LRLFSLRAASAAPRGAAMTAWAPIWRELPPPKKTSKIVAKDVLMETGDKQGLLA
jgi:hypothetical protein